MARRSSDRRVKRKAEAATARDPQGANFDVSDRSEAVATPHQKTVAILVDEDVLDFFKQQGAGYQRRMGAVLRSYVQHKRKKRP
jgi:uncharacterized protein (DUF4415 family)